MNFTYRFFGSFLIAIFAFNLESSAFLEADPELSGLDLNPRLSMLVAQCNEPQVRDKAACLEMGIEILLGQRVEEIEAPEDVEPVIRDLTQFEESDLYVVEGRVNGFAVNR